MGYPLGDDFCYGFSRAEFRLLSEIANLRIFSDDAFPHEFSIDARHDAQQARLTRAIPSDHANTRTKKEGEVHLF